MADPTLNAYNRIPTRGTPRSHSVPTLSLVDPDIAPHPSYAELFDSWATLRDCYDGETAVKNASETYLPKLSAHNSTEYEAYKSRASFYNAVRRTHRGLMGSLFRKPVEVTLPSSLTSSINLSRVTQDAQPFSTFARIVGHEILLTGRIGIIADFKNDRADSPYLAGYLAENIFHWRLREHRDREIVDRVVLLENELVPTEYGHTSSLLIRILRLDEDPDSRDPSDPDLVYSQTIIRPSVPSPGGPPVGAPTKFTKRILGRGGRPIRYIPFVFANATSLSADPSAPPLEDIARINISHYRSTAHLEHGRFYAGMPTYYISGPGTNHPLGNIPGGLSNPSPMVVGPSNVWELEENAKAGILEFTGHGLTFLENAVDSKQLQMQSLGGRLISSTRRAAALSDEAWQLLETGDEATLMDVAVTCDEACARALAYLGDLSGLLPDSAFPRGVSEPDPARAKIVVEFNKEFVRSELTAREIRALQSLRERGHIPEDVMYYALREVGVVPVEYSLDDFSALLKRKDQQYVPPPPEIPAAGGGGSLPGVRPQPVRPATGSE